MTKLCSLIACSQPAAAHTRVRLSGAAGHFCASCESRLDAAGALLPLTPCAVSPEPFKLTTDQALARMDRDELVELRDACTRQLNELRDADSHALRQAAARLEVAAREFARANGARGVELVLTMGARSVVIEGGDFAGLKIRARGA